MHERLKEYVAVVWKKNSEDPGVHETFHAHTYEEVEAMLEKKYGKDIVVSLIDVEASARPR